MDSACLKRAKWLNVYELKSTRHKTAEANTRIALNHYKRQSNALSLNISNGRVFVIEDAHQLRRFDDVLRRDSEKQSNIENKNIERKRLHYGLRIKSHASLAENFSEVNPSGRYEVKFVDNMVHKKETFKSELFSKIHFSRQSKHYMNHDRVKIVEETTKFSEIYKLKESHHAKNFF